MPWHDAWVVAPTQRPLQFLTLALPGLHAASPILRLPRRAMTQATDDRVFMHRIDADGRLCFVNDAWLDFADENGWRTSAAELLGTPLIAQITGAEPRHIYRLLIERTRQTGRPARFAYRCDSPDLRRFMEMRISILSDGQVEFCSRVLRLDPRERVQVLDSALRQRSEEVLQMCSWCKAVCAQPDWLELEDAVQRLGILAEAAPPRISHGICPTCSERLMHAGGAL
jgi:hypothetical protein